MLPTLLQAKLEEVVRATAKWGRKPLKAATDPAAAAAAAAGGDEDCPVCLCEIDGESSYRLQGCGHSYHNDCLLGDGNTLPFIVTSNQTRDPTCCSFDGKQTRVASRRELVRAFIYVGWLGICNTDNTVTDQQFTHLPIHGCTYFSNITRANMFFLRACSCMRAWKWGALSRL